MLELEQEFSGTVIKKKLSAPRKYSTYCSCDSCSNSCHVIQNYSNSLCLGLSSGPRMAEEDSEDDNDSDVDEPGKNDQFQEEDFKIDPKDESAFNAFMNTNIAPRKTLADLVRALTIILKFRFSIFT